ncbi:RNA polymerase sigma factor [Spirosoma terrae]|uniref:RNA polymerase sigma factor n=1 Tax=Spirosoma terrae TaxID=1968276 RepID=A0A6L9L5S6_9BACT|nr:RNA polymerase sigma factor [Spirosoma terrae]NDU95916.1 RNA polymerase sigma factor [Spirosoma terrae]
MNYNRDANDLTDNSLMEKVKGGNAQLLTVLFMRYHKDIYRFIFRFVRHKEESQDLLQTVFYRVLKYKHTYKENYEFRTWLYQITRNVVSDNFKKNGLVYYSDENSLADKADDSLLIDQEIEKQQQIDSLNLALDKLSFNDREVIILSRFQNLGYVEIAKILNSTEGAVRVKLHRAINELKLILHPKSTK